MKKYSVFDLNFLWLLFTLLHICGAGFIPMLAIIPFGVEIFLTGLALLIFLGIREYKYSILAGGIVLFALFVVFQLLGDMYKLSFILNMIMLSAMIYLAGRDKISVLSYMRIKVPKLKEILFAMILTAGALIMSMYLNYISMYYSTNHVADVIKNSSHSLGSAILILAVIPAIVEEMMFRGYIYRASSNKLQAILLSAICFALLHGNLNQITYALFSGCFFGLVLYVTDNLSVTIIMHILFNTYSIIGNLLINKPWGQKILQFKIGTYCPFNPVKQIENMRSDLGYGFLVFAVTGICMAALLYLLYQSKKGEERSIADIREEDNVWRPDLRFIIATALCLITSFFSH